MSIRNVINVYSRKSYILKKKAKPLERKIFSECKEVNDLVVTAKAMACRGLAAPQIGSSLRMFAIKDDYTGLVDIVINPKIITINRFPSSSNVLRFCQINHNHKKHALFQS